MLSHLLHEQSGEGTGEYCSVPLTQRPGRHLSQRRGPADYAHSV